MTGRHLASTPTGRCARCDKATRGARYCLRHTILSFLGWT